MRSNSLCTGPICAFDRFFVCFLKILVVLLQLPNQVIVSWKQVEQPLLFAVNFKSLHSWLECSILVHFCFVRARILLPFQAVFDELRSCVRRFQHFLFVFLLQFIYVHLLVLNYYLFLTSKSYFRHVFCKSFLFYLAVYFWTVG